MSSTAALPPAYRSALLVATAAALDAGIFYQDAFAAFVLDRIGSADPPQDHFLGVFEEPPEFQQRSSLRTVVQSQVVRAPRGTWAVIRHTRRDRGASFFRPVMSDGSNEPATGGSFDTYEDMPSFSTVHRRMGGYEVYLARNEVEAERSRARNLALINEHGFAVGNTYRNLAIGRATYSTVTITALHPAPSERLMIIGTDHRGPGWLSLGMVKRGSRYRYRVDLAAATLAAAIKSASTNRPMAVALSVQPSLDRPAW